jgi:hypothetical protein
MSQRMSRAMALALAAATVACVQEPQTLEAPPAGAFAIPTGKAACDEYLSLAQSCVQKGLQPGGFGPRELDLLDRTVRQVVGGTPVRLDLGAVWSSAVQTAKVETHGLKVDLAKLEANGELAKPELFPASIVCKRGIDQLPAACQ